MPRVAWSFLAACSFTVLAALAGASCGSSPTQPTPAPPAASRDLAHFEELVGTSWTGTAQFTVTGGQAVTAPVALVFLWGGTCDNPGYLGCATGYNPYGWGTTDGVPTTIRGHNALFVAGFYNRSLDIGETPALGSGNWNTARLAGDRQRLVIESSDFTWGDRLGVRFELTRAPWPPDVRCPSFRTCGAW